ncbi:uncharacterized protein F4812DRAFT_420770 [Daldinia caldariorum]|uniref:uncharacterized protein n=1 Tax=Daldinia caldariorum TaxID=326644 RepID=UPI0020077083|nr:uncharacterized protein F4812DRAFT_420770 [Daldinia caldariorum]KAI1469898.1 hypothetical protein F4812DRAFT_420770 [Daldinia caldariorum]
MQRPWWRFFLLLSFFSFFSSKRSYEFGMVLFTHCVERTFLPFVYSSVVRDCPLVGEISPWQIAPRQQSGFQSLALKFENERT